MGEDKYLGLNNLGYFVEKIRNDLVGMGVVATQEEYLYRTKTYEIPSLSLPDFKSSRDSVNVFMNGFLLAKTVDYSLENATITFLSELPPDQLIHVLVIKRGVAHG